jgi:hypothetical protein
MQWMTGWRTRVHKRARARSTKRPLIRRCDHSRPFEERVTTLVANLTNEEKAVKARTTREHTPGASLWLLRLSTASVSAELA